MKVEVKKKDGTILPYNLQFFAGSNDDSTGENGEKDGEAGQSSDNGEKAKSGQENEADKKFTQADIDKAIQDRLKRESKKFERQIEDLKKQFTAGGDSEGNAYAGGQQTNPEVDKLLAVANQRLIEATATSEAVKLGVDTKYIADVVKLANLSGVEVKEDGTIDTNAVSKAIDEVIKRVPVFKVTEETSGGFKIGGDKGQKDAGTGWGNKAPTSNLKRWNKTNRW